MKKSKSWIHVCVRFLLFITFGVHSATFKFTETDDTDRIIPSLRQNIPKDYKIPVTYISKEVGGMCWANLNVFNLEQSLGELLNKFGNVSSNKDDIRILIEYLTNEREDIENLDAFMMDFQCHYRTEKWETERYFDFVKELYKVLKHENSSNECEEPPCPTTTEPLDSPTPSELPTPTPTGNNTDAKCTTNYQSPACSQSDKISKEPLDMMKLLLLSLLFVSVLTIILMCVVWKVRWRSNRRAHQQRPGEDDSFTGSEGTEPPGSAETQEKIMLNVIETV